MPGNKREVSGWYHCSRKKGLVPGYKREVSGWYHCSRKRGLVPGYKRKAVFSAKARERKKVFGTRVQEKGSVLYQGTIERSAFHLLCILYCGIRRMQCLLPWYIRDIIVWVLGRELENCFVPEQKIYHSFCYIRTNNGCGSMLVFTFFSDIRGIFDSK